MLAPGRMHLFELEIAVVAQTQTQQFRRTHEVALGVVEMPLLIVVGEGDLFAQLGQTLQQTRDLHLFAERLTLLEHRPGIRDRPAVLVGRLLVGGGRTGELTSHDLGIDTSSECLRLVVEGFGAALRAIGSHVVDAVGGHHLIDQPAAARGLLCRGWIGLGHLHGDPIDRRDRGPGSQASEHRQQCLVAHRIHLPLPQQPRQRRGNDLQPSG